MPQIEKITYITTIYWVFISYFVLYLDMIVTYLYKFVTFLKLDLKRLAIIMKTSLCYKQYQNIVRQWSNYPVLVNGSVWSFLSSDENRGKGEYRSRFPRPEDHENFLHNFYDYDKWLLYFWGRFEEDQWFLTVACMFILYPFVLKRLYDALSQNLVSAPTFSTRTRIAFVACDVLLNALLCSILLMGEPTNLQVGIMICPVIFSPFFLFFELFIYFWVMTLRVRLLLVDKELPSEKKLQQEKQILKDWFLEVGLFCMVGMMFVADFYNIHATTVAYWTALGALFVIIFVVVLFASLAVLWTMSNGSWEKKYREKLIATHREKNATNIAAMYHIVRKRSTHYEEDLRRELRCIEEFSQHGYSWKTLWAQPRQTCRYWRVSWNKARYEIELAFIEASKKEKENVETKKTEKSK